MTIPRHDRMTCDVLIIGGGGSGALAGLEASGGGKLKVIIASRGPISQSGLTPTGNGGTAASNSTEHLFKNMVTAGNYLNDQNVISLMFSETQDAIEKLKKIGVTVTPLGPHGICVPGVETLSLARRELRKRSNVVLLEDVLITRLIREDEKITGAIALDLTTAELFEIDATAVIVATGGIAGELYPRTSNNPFGVATDASGTGHVMAYLAGADLIDMEMMAFVPLPTDPRCINLRYFPEFWRGPYLNRHGDVIESDIEGYLGASYSYLFLQKLAREFEKGNGPIYIDQRAIERPDHASGIHAWDRRRRYIKSLGIDPNENKIELAIGSHFCMGGIYVNEKTETTIPGLFAAGEIMGGVHGGLRLPGYSFTQMIVFGFVAGRQAADYAGGGRKAKGSLSRGIGRDKERIFGFLKPKRDPVSLGVLKTRLQQEMERDVFIYRDKRGLERAVEEILKIKEEITRIQVHPFKRFNLEWIRAIEFSMMIEGAEIIARSALYREESRGFHYRRDFENRNDKRWLKHTVARLQEDSLILDTAPVVLDRMKPEE
jgi:succinate dehydrogenase/fumarate reductase flavoprotein subunit